MSLSTIIDAVNVELALIPGIVTAIGEKHLAGNHAPRRFVWVPGDATPTPAKKGDGITEVVGALDWPVNVHCWGASLDEAERMVAALLTAARKTHKSNVKLTRVSPLPVESSYSQSGYVLVAVLNISVQIIKQDLETFADFAHTTKLITAVEFDPTTASEIDGVIDVGDIAP